MPSWTPQALEQAGQVRASGASMRGACPQSGQAKKAPGAATGCFPDRPAAGEDAGGELPPVAGELGEGVHADQQLEREVALEQADAVVRDGELALDGKAALPQPAAHGFGVEVEVEGGELDRLGGEGAPVLAPRSSSAGWL